MLDIFERTKKEVFQEQPKKKQDTDKIWKSDRWHFRWDAESHWRKREAKKVFDFRRKIRALDCPWNLGTLANSWGESLEELKLESHLQLQFELGGDSSCRKFTILDSKSLKMVEENGWRLLVFSTAIGPLEIQEPANVKPKEFNPRGLLNLVIQRFLNLYGRRLSRDHSVTQ